MAKSFYIQTMGCQMNEYDSDYLAQSLLSSGLRSAAGPEDADIVLVNTCVVRAKPEQKAYSLIGRIAKIKRCKPNLVLVVVGCLAQKQGSELMRRFPDINLVAGPREIGKVRQAIEGIGQDGGRKLLTDLRQAPPEPAGFRGYFNGRVTGSIAIMEGCNNFCSYCIVPFVRGREISRAPQEIVAEAEALVAEGIKEITLLGQNVNSYRWGEKGDWNFVRLLRELNRLEGLRRLRFTTSHPKDLSDELISCFKDLPCLCPHIHLPLQAGSNHILERMRRGYTREHYLNLVEKLRWAEPGIAITSDVMVGFPGESEQDFQLTLDLVERVQFDGLFSFKYSDREGTLAASMSPKINADTKAVRLDTLQGLQKQISLQKNQQLERGRMKVLIEGRSKRSGQLTGRTTTNRIVNLICDPSYIGNIIDVKIEKAFLNSLRGRAETFASYAGNE